MRVALDEQIFAIQAYGGISRLFADLAKQFINEPGLDVELQPLNAPIINRYVLDDEQVRAGLGVWEAGNAYTSLGRYFTRLQPRRGVDIIHNTFYLPHSLASTRGAKRIVSVYDMIPELMPATRRRLDLLTLKRRYVDRADHIICISEATRLDLLRVYPEVSAPISVVHLGVDPRFAPGGAPLAVLPDDYLLMVGNRSQYKDATTLFHAFAAVAHEFPEMSLVCIGGGPLTRNELDLLKHLGIASRVRQQDLPDEDMPAVYGNARAFVFPSRFEGFGLPVIEAMACGVPTILANATSLPEIGADAARYFEVGNPDALATVLREVLGDGAVRDELRAMGVARARSFTWRRTAQETVAAYRSALSA